VQLATVVADGAGKDPGMLAQQGFFATGLQGDIGCHGVFPEKGRN
jgi:hypothetical protein